MTWENILKEDDSYKQRKEWDKDSLMRGKKFREELTMFLSENLALKDYYEREKLGSNLRLEVLMPSIDTMMASLAKYYRIRGPKEN
tara:strand:+ start:85 stop:342 length:258 start_codon:yes stop_codon:yes gene_type:complete